MSTKLLEDRINTWVQIAGIVIAAVWAAYTFVYKEIWVPAAVPVNTTLGLEIRPADSQSAARHKGMIPLTIVASATNPSTRTIEFFRSVFVVYGYRNQKKEAFKFDVGNAQKATNADTLQMESLFSEKQDVSLVATGRLFEDAGLKPGEKITRTQVLFIPPDAFDVVEVIAYVPSATHADGLEQQWRLNGLGVDPIVLVKGSGKEANTATLNAHEYGESEARTMIAL